MYNNDLMWLNNVSFERCAHSYGASRASCGSPRVLLGCLKIARDFAAALPSISSALMSSLGNESEALVPNKVRTITQRQYPVFWLIVIGALLIFSVLPGIMMNVARSNDGAPGALDVLASVFGFFAFYLLIFQALIGIRFIPLERLVGLDQFWKIHKWNSLVFLVIVILHIIFKYWAYCEESASYASAMLGSSNCSAGGFFEYWWVFTEKISYGGYGVSVISGRIAWYYFLVQTVITFFSRGPNGSGIVPRLIWYPVHLLAWLTFVPLFVHALWNKLPSTSEGAEADGWSIAFTTIFAILYVLAIVYRVLRLVYVRRSGAYRITKIHAISENLTALRLARTASRPFICDRMLAQQPGQFAILYSRTHTPHPLSGALLRPDGEEEQQLEFIVRRNARGKFTNALLHYDTQETMYLDGPYGLMVPPFGNEATDILLISGGCGIAPLFAALSATAEREASVYGRVTLIWSIHDPKDFAAVADRLEGIYETFRDFKFALVLSTREGDAELYQQNHAHVLEPIDVHSFTHVSRGLLRDYIVEGQESSTRAYICGPPPMMFAIKKDLKSIGVKQVFFEHFSML
eukprot:gnl/Chilomastix_cuspidata/1199.p1 GENE.gnl/Chilomastix_cuspidata/1199~~gnl/Chilomastix_cuspidata/1199.p1  ORF type:complete len:577 (+),score=183.53 gnl/Chilomastix_cuspidata/1199:1139-2869(+)